ncbi:MULTISPECIES: peptidoglycan DD-metalloendopeptidase family protein [unclassified Sphingomonas]|uniref:murein hydrolase activator EnvC family protein n=2 Tax=Sphingomonas TaxID=13687 RepID=UPI002269AE82|nr:MULTISPECIES: peptidoglycan DD-metalloendopeptidase family protein [unclassified Sphingomonas]
MRAWAPIIAVMLAGSATGAVPSLADQQQRLASAKREAAAASARAAGLVRQAANERDAADKAAADEAALSANVTAAEAQLAAARARSAIVAQLLAARRAQLGEAQTPVARLLAALQSLARRPTVVAIAQPGSVDDLVHVRAVLGGALPVVRARTGVVRAEIEQTRRLQASAALAASALRDSRAQLESDRVALARLEAAHRQRSQALGRHAIGESDRALALGEQARDLVDQLSARDLAQATATDLAQLDGPLPRPVATAAAMARPSGAYRLPVGGRLVTGLDEVSAAGVRSRGLTFAVEPRAPVRAPAGGTVRYARQFRDFGMIVIIDHGDGWTSLLTGLGRLAVTPGQAVAAGAMLGRAGVGDDAAVTVELRRCGRPMDIVALL